MTSKPKLFDVVIYQYVSNKIEAVIGRNLSEAKADKREMTGMNRVNENYGVAIITAGAAGKGDELPMKTF